MKTVKRLLAVFGLMLSVGVQAQVTYFESNNFFLTRLTDTGFSSYNWRFEPFKTDVERGWLHGNVSKVVTTIKDKTGRGFGEDFSDTTYYNRQGNILRVVAPKKDPYSPQKRFKPDTWIYEYNAKGQLTGWTWETESDNIKGIIPQKHIHTVQRDTRGNATKEMYHAYSWESGKWQEFGSLSPETWSFIYDANGQLTSGNMDLDSGRLTYKNGQLVSMITNNEWKPLIYTYDANGRMKSMKYYVLDEYDDDEIIREQTITFTYNQQGDIAKADGEVWDCNERFARTRRSFVYAYTITYTYDAKGNWTKAVMASKNIAGGYVGNNAAAITITRVFTYDKFDQPAAQQKTVVADSQGQTGKTPGDGDLWIDVEEAPSFPGGQNALIEFMQNNMTYPADAEANMVQGTVRIQFVVNKEGSLEDIKVAKSVYPSLDKEAVRLVKAMPKWKPGKIDGKPVRVRYTIPIRFKLK